MTDKQEKFSEENLEVESQASADLEKSAKAEKESLVTEKPAPPGVYPKGHGPKTAEFGGKKKLSPKEIEDKKKELLDKVKKLKEKIDVTKTEELKEQVKIKKRADMLIPLEEYVRAGIYLGTRVVTPDMKPFVYRRRADGLAIFNTDIIDEKLKEGIEYLSKFNPEDIILACKRQAGWNAAKMFSHLTGIRVFTKKYPAGILTNITLPDFFENKLTIVIDSWLDKNALKDTMVVKKNVLMICDTNNFSKGANQIIIGNNKSAKSLGVIFYLLARGYCKAKKIDVEIPDLEWWTGEKE